MDYFLNKKKKHIRGVHEERSGLSAMDKRSIRDLSDEEERADNYSSGMLLMNLLLLRLAMYRSFLSEAVALSDPFIEGKGLRETTYSSSYYLWTTI